MMALTQLLKRSMNMAVKTQAIDFREALLTIMYTQVSSER